MENPRKEKKEYYYNPKYSGFVELSLKPNLLTDKVMKEMFEVVDKYKNRIHKHKIFRGVKW